MTITGTTGGSGTRAISKGFPAVDGLTGGTTKQTGHTENLLPQEYSNVPKRERRGFDGRQ